MNNVANATAQKLLGAVKTAVSRYGLAGSSIRMIGEVSGVNEGLIYRYYKDKNDLLQQAYEYESNTIFLAMTGYLDEVHNIPFSFRDRAKLSIHRIWRELLSDRDRLDFVTCYYHYFDFKQVSICHEKQIEKLTEKIGRFFKSREACINTIYMLLSILYDSSKRVLDGMAEDTPEVEEKIFSMCYALLLSQLNETTFAEGKN